MPLVWLLSILPMTWPKVVSRGLLWFLRALFHFNPAYTTLLINIPLLLIGGENFRQTFLYYTLIGTVSLSVFLWFWQKFPVEINLDHDLLIAALLAGLAAGFGSGLVYRVGGTTGGTDVIARIFEKYFGISMGRSLLLLMLQSYSSRWPILMSNEWCIL